MDCVYCPCCKTPMQIVRKRQVFRYEVAALPSYECPNCHATAMCDKWGQLSYFDATGKLIYPSQDK